MIMKKFRLGIAFLLVAIAAAGSSPSSSSGKGKESSPSSKSSKSKAKGKGASPSSSSSGKGKGSPSSGSEKAKSKDSSSKASKVGTRSSKSGKGKGKGKGSSPSSSSSGKGKGSPSRSSMSQSKKSSSKASKVSSPSSSSSGKGKGKRSSPSSPTSSAKSNRSPSSSSSKSKSKDSSSKASKVITSSSKSGKGNINGASPSSSKKEDSSPSTSQKGSHSSSSKAGPGNGLSPSMPTESSPESSLPQVPDTGGPKTCVCSANATFEDNVLTMNFDMCEEEPMVADWVGIYRCDAATTIATEVWWNEKLESSGYIGEPEVSMEYYGFVPGQEYVIDQQLWWSYTCSSPTNGEEQCQQSDSTVWPSEGSVTVDPSVAPRWAFWGQAFGGVLDPGCYKVMLNRDVSDEISPPPLPTVCSGQPWQDAFEFEVEAESTLPQLPETEEPTSPDTTTCICSANATFEDNVLTMNFDMCEEEPMVADWVGIYRCDAATTIATEEWWNEKLESSGYIGEPGVSMEYYGFVPGQEYVIDQQLWWSYTCSSPTNGEEQCQQSDSTVWPSEGSVTVDPSVAPRWAFWGQAFGGVLDPGCYKVMLNRDVGDEISPPPLPTVCSGEPWQDAFEFEVE